jgi:hypothetical protein
VVFVKSLKDNRESFNDALFDGHVKIAAWLRQIEQNWLRPYARIRIIFDELISEPIH